MTVRVMGIHRSPRYSPGRHRENDRLIFEATVQVLQQRGWTVQTIAEDELETIPLGARVVFSMCQGSPANAKLLELEERGALVINSPRAVRNCYRERLHYCLARDPGLFAPTLLVPTHGEIRIPPFLYAEGGCWIKRGDVHATQPGDVVRVDSETDYLAVLREFSARDIPVAIVVPHIKGEVVKFYGVLGSSFFRYYREDDPSVVPAELAAVRPDVERLVSRIGLEIYGGDAIVTAEGRVFVIDINDWPSYALFRDEACQAIAQHIVRRALALETQVGTSRQPDAVA